MKKIPLYESKSSKQEDDVIKACVMLYGSFPLISEFHKLIDREDINEEEGGLEKDTHITLLYGLHHGEFNIDELDFKDYVFDDILCLKVDMFEKEEYDVLKISVEGESLNSANEYLKTFPYTNDYPDYKPHITIAYLNKGAGKKYAGEFTKMIEETDLFVPDKVIYSHKEDEEYIDQEIYKIERDEE